MVAARPCLEVGDERRWAELGYEDQMVTGPVLMGRAIWWADSRNKIKDNRKLVGLQWSFGPDSRNGKWAAEISFQIDSRIFLVQIKRFKCFQTKFELDSK
jgi:hypothetical protein